MAGQRRAASLTGSRRPRLGDAKPVAKRAERVLQRTGQRLRAGYGLAERLLLVLDLIEKTHCLSFFLMWIGGVPNTASLADGRKFLRASSHDLVVVREVAGAERAGIDGKLLELLADVSELVLVSDVDESSGPRRLIDMMSLFDSSCEILTE